MPAPLARPGTRGRSSSPRTATVRTERGNPYHGPSHHPSELEPDRLEGREILSGNVTAFVSSNTLFLGEAAGQYGQSNAVQVTQLASGNIRVTGLLNGSGTAHPD